METNLLFVVSVCGLKFSHVIGSKQTFQTYF